MGSVYVQNLEERAKSEPLTDALRTIFSEFGQVVDVVAKTNLKAKGQAFVVFAEAASAREAAEEINGFPLFDKPMRLAMARSRSDKTVEMSGSPAELEAHPPPSLYKTKRDKKLTKRHGKRPGGGTPADGRPSKIAKPSGLKSTSVAQAAVIPDEYLPPNKILFLQNVPDDYDVEGLAGIFGRFDGFREVRLVPGRRGIAFVEYEAEQGAVAAKESTAGITLGDRNLKVTYQRQ
ncbi:small nuclear ribonucleoprotein [Cordyceps fumosorosea ARSEF 2679]|uniref:Small nuclear ribonucleoprotein n=1 Tax=Cordyceps fumosorosea (strain ARSEF 2679) TaxID=1081104 RepID=A0A167NWJ6_CORFA|nr:small nuclear ribonucleoprotein [Cordyceps fumosorosea ARSEF 2679]OAA56019.1 small nuclear ribonucleoprotein [Cordyceps fumosorosea ARSEF 2679]